MAKPKLSFESRSLAGLGILLVASKSYYPIMLLAHELGQTAAWLLTLMASLLAALFVWPVAAALRKLPGGNLIDLARVAFGRAGAIVTAVVLAGSLSFMGAMILRETSEMALTAAYPHTPQTFATVSLLLGAVFVACGDSKMLVMLSRMLLPALLTALLVILAGSVGWGQWRTITPILGPGVRQLALSTPAVANFFAPVCLLYLLADGARSRGKLVRWIMAVPLLTGLALAAEKAVLGVVFPYPIGTDITFPLHAAARILLGGRFFERMEGLWLFMWVASTITLSGAFLHGSAAAISRAFRMPRHTTAVAPLATVVLTLAFFPRNQADTVGWHEGAALWLFVFTLVFPAAVAITAQVRMRWGAHAR